MKHTRPWSYHNLAGNQRSKNAVAPYHYIRIQELDNPYYDLLIVGGEDHPTGNSDDAKKRYSSLEAWTRKRFRIEGIEYRWSGQVLEPKDSLAFIERNPRDKRGNISIATGDSGNGMTHGAIAGMILSDLVLGKHNRWAALYNPSRRIKSKPRRSGVGATHSGKTEKSRSDELQPGEGMVIEKKILSQPTETSQANFITIPPCVLTWAVL